MKGLRDCDNCKKRFLCESVVFSCRSCNYDFCVSCFEYINPDFEVVWQHEVYEISRITHDKEAVSKTDSSLLTRFRPFQIKFR